MQDTTRSWHGEDLAAIRRAAGLRQTDIADRLGVARSRIAHLEGSRAVTVGAARRYIDAVTDLRAVVAAR